MSKNINKLSTLKKFCLGVFFVGLILSIIYSGILIYKNSKRTRANSLFKKSRSASLFNGDKSKGILSFSGGGMKSVATDTGVIYGIRKRLTGKLTLNQFLDQYKILSSNSGGSWFATLMIYSPAFFKMLSQGNLHSNFDNCMGNPVPESEKWFAKCGIYGMDKCGTNNKQCCCAYGYKYNNNILNKCQLCNLKQPEFTFNEYIIRVLNVIKTETSSDKYTNMVIDLLPDYIGGNYIKPFIYYYNKSWNKINKEIIFDTVGDISSNISDNPNNITNHCVWSAVILQNSNIVNDIQYYIGDENKIKCSSDALINDCGVIAPITFDFDHSEKKSTLSIYGGNIEKNVNIYYKDYDSKKNQDKIIFPIQTYLSNTTPSNTLPSIISACSSSAGAIVAETQLLNKAIDTAIGKGFFKDILSGGIKKVVENISKYLSNLAVPMKLHNDFGNIEIFNGDIDSSYDKILSNKYIKIGDGAYYDNSSITNGLRAWQKDGGVGVCKIINITPTNSGDYFQNPEKNKKIDSNIYNLFGCTGGTLSRLSCLIPNPKVFDKIDSPSFLKNTLPMPLPHIFQTEDFYKERCLWFGRCSRNNLLKCGDSNSKCIVEIAVIYYKTTTINNEMAGVSAGTPVELYVISVNCPKSPMMVLPGSNDVSTGLDYVNTSIKISELIQKIPEDLFNIIFLDKGDINTYSGKCEISPLC